jgi:hypothetical protein
VGSTTRMLGWCPRASRFPVPAEPPEAVDIRGEISIIAASTTRFSERE